MAACPRLLGARSLSLSLPSSDAWQTPRASDGNPDSLVLGLCFQRPFALQHCRIYMYVHVGLVWPVVVFERLGRAGQPAPGCPRWKRSRIGPRQPRPCFASRTRRHDVRWTLYEYSYVVGRGPTRGCTARPTGWQTCTKVQHHRNPMDPWRGIMKMPWSFNYTYLILPVLTYLYLRDCITDRLRPGAARACRCTETAIAAGRRGPRVISAVSIRPTGTTAALQESILPCCSADVVIAA